MKFKNVENHNWKDHDHVPVRQQWTAHDYKNIQFPIQVISNIHYVNIHNKTKELNSRLETFIRNTGDQMKRVTNVKASMTKYRTKCAEFDELTLVINEYMSKFYMGLIPPRIVDLDYTETWGAIYRKGDYTELHCHEPSKLSWIYYVKVSEKTAPLYIHQIVNDDNQKETFKLVPKVSDLIYFPSWTPHSVPTEKSDEERIVVSGNTNIIKSYTPQKF